MSSDVETPAPSRATKKAPRPCERCGVFAKRRRVLGRRLCEDCVERTLPPAVREPSLPAALRGGVSAMFAASSVALVAVVAGTLSSLPAVVAEVRAEPLWSLLFASGEAIVAYPLLFPLVAHAAWAWTRRETPTLGDAWRRAVRSYRRLFWPSLWVSLTAGGAAMLFVVPGLVRLAMTSFVLPIVLFEERATAGAVSESIDRSVGQRWTLLGCYAPSLLLAVTELFTAEAPSLPVALARSVAYAALGPVESAAITILYASDRLKRKI